MRRRCVFLVLLAVLAQPPHAGAAEPLYVVVNAANPVRLLSTRDLVALYTGRSRTFPDGSAARALDQAGPSAARENFYRALTGMDLARINSYWARLLFSGQLQPPVQLANDEAVAAQVRRSVDALGYLSAAPTDPALRVVAIVRP